MLSDRSRFFALLLALVTALTLVAALSWLAPAAHARSDKEYEIICNNPVLALRLIINTANDNPGRDEIVIVPPDPSMTGPCTITLTTAEDDYGNGAVGLPLITDTLVIRGEGIDVVFERDLGTTDVFRLLETTADLTLENVTVRNGRTYASRYGGGILAHQSLTLTNVVLTGNVSYGGGGAYVGGALTMNRTTVVNNEARSDNPAYGGGIWVEGALAAEAITVTGNVGDDVYGAGLYAAAGAHITGGWFAENEGSRGAGLYAAGDLTLTDSAFYSNTAGSYGGGLLAEGALTLADSTFAHNEAGSGGGLYVEEPAGPAVQVVDGNFEHNHATTSGGGLFVLRTIHLDGAHFNGNEAAEGGGGGFITSGVISDTLFAQNAASGLGVDYAGGGLLVLYDAEIRSSRFLSNRAPSGGGVFLAQVPPGDFSLLVNNLWVDNEANDGSAIFAGFTADEEENGGHAEINHNTIVRREQSGSAIQIVEGSANVINSIITRHTVGVSASPDLPVISDYNLFYENLVRHAGVPSGANNLDGDPGFVDAAGGDYRLRFDSPAVDSGADLGLGVDLDGVERPQRADYDRGAYEYVNVPPTAASETYTTTAALTIPAPGVLGNDGDFEGDELTAVLVSGPDHGNLTLNSDGSFTYTPAAGFTGSDAFTYRAGDGYDRSSPATVTVVVEPLRVYLPAVLRP